MKYQTKYNAIISANEHGSAARTFAGAARFLISVATNNQPLHQRGSKSRWGRTARDIEAYSIYRKNERMTNKGIRISSELGLWAKDDAIEACEIAVKNMMEKRHTIPLGTDSSNQLRKFGYEKEPRKQNWTRPSVSKREQLPMVVTNNLGRYSSKCTYTHFTYTPVIGCWGSVRPLGTLEFCYGTHINYLAPPRGYKWDIDSNGIRIVSLSNAKKDYHPDSDELRSYTKQELAKKASDLFIKRQQEAKKAHEEFQLDKLSKDEQTKLIAKAEREGCLVCVQDALRAGNCKNGILEFVAKHKLNPKKHYSPSRLLKIANGSIDRVKLAVAVALRRHRHELKTGVCELSQHQHQLV